MIKASVYIICQNEEKHIKRCLESVKDFDEIIIVDSGSSDKTLEIASAYTDKIFHQDFLGYAKQKEFAKNLCSHEWVLNLDADEELSSELKNEIITITQNDDCDGLEVNIFSKYLGKFPNKLCKAITRIRFFRKNLGSYGAKLVHESISLNGKVKKSKNFIYDHGLTTIQTQIDKINSYSSLRASEKSNKNRSASSLKLIFVFPLAFFKSYIVRRNFLNGKRGFILAVILAFYAFLKEAKLYEQNLNNKKN
ncbi:glycosyltransferase, family 2 [Campylobacter iguaniorum]|uniref:glycosyltransferase family 2 protein n=1 Tax=Campylobacter iguaniorum TaxID=1244531 RepID=UPI00073A1143|nr:glycosyltransferase family 2 protein [Campylobacter iguaniorum]ALV25164.1 glycosyltransferase, family 2 [Campylobacter iguaniorum]